MVHELLPTPATTTAFRLGEGPIWDPVREQVLWVDIFEGSVVRASFESDKTLQIDEVITFPDLASAVTIAETGEMLVAGRNRFYIREPGGAVRWWHHMIAPDSFRRFNDGKPDPAGRFVVGTLDMNSASEAELLVRTEPDGTITVIDDDLTLSNGLAWSVDGTRMFSVDTHRRLIYVRSYNSSTGETGPRTVFAELLDGYPDGICIDADDHLWVAGWGAGAVHRYSPDGVVTQRLALPAPHPTSVCFAGRDLGILVISTATQGLTDDQITEYPLSGRVFTVRTGAHGPQTALWAGSAGFDPPPSLGADERTAP